MTYVALLRGINVGGNSKVEMARLRSLFGSLGFSDVQTYINSGNVIFVSSEPAEQVRPRIESAIENDFGLKVRVLILDLLTVEKLVNAIPDNWVNDKQMKCDVMLLWQEINSRDILNELPANPRIEDIKYTPGAVIWRIDRNNVNKSRMFRLVGTDLYKKMTVRNSNTVRKIYQLMKEAGE